MGGKTRFAAWRARAQNRLGPVALFVYVGSALGTALWAQIQLPEHAVQGGLVFGLSAAVFVLTMAFFGTQESGDLAYAPESSLPSLRQIALILSSIVPGIVALILFHFDKTPNVVISLWGLSVLLALHGAWRLDRGRPAGPLAAPWTRLELAILVGIVILAAFLRVWRIWDFPGVYEDEGVHLTDAHRILDGVIRTPFVSLTWSDGAIFDYPLAGMLALGIDPIIALKLMGIVPGVLTCLFLYLLLRELFAPPAAVLGTALVAVSSWHILVSRWGYVHSLDLLFIAMLLYFLARGLRTRRFIDFALGGTALGFGLLFSKEAMSAPLLIGGTFAFLVVRSRGRALAVFGRHFILLTLVALLLFAPRALYIAEQPGVALARPKEVYLFNQERWADQKQQPWIRAGRNIHELLLTFNYRSGYEPRWNTGFRRPTLDVVSGALLVLGLAYALSRVKEPRYFLLLMTVVAIVLPASAALALDDRPVTYRILGVAPVVYGLAALPLWLLWREARAPPIRGAVALAAIALLGGSAYLNYDAYFNQYGTSTDVYYATGQVETRVAKHVLELNDPYHVYVTNLQLFYPVLDIILRDRASYDAITSVEEIPLTSADGRPLAFVVVEQGKWSDGTLGEELLVALRRIYPEGREVTGESDPTGTVVYVTYFVDTSPGGQSQTAGQSRP